MRTRHCDGRRLSRRLVFGLPCLLFVLGSTPIYGQNLLANGAFAGNLSGWLLDADFGTSISYTPSVGRTALGAADVFLSGGYDYHPSLSQCVAVSPSTSYVAQAFVKGDAAGVNNQASLSIQYYTLGACTGSLVSQTTDSYRARCPGRLNAAYRLERHRARGAGWRR
jgi:hypothetical protein